MAEVARGVAGRSRAGVLGRRAAAVPAWAALGGLVALSAGLRGWAGSRVPVPWIPVDETIYAKLGLSLYHSGRLVVLGGPTGFYSLVYPAFAGVPLSLAGLGTGYEALKALQAVVISLAAVPVYLWARSLSTRGLALLAAALALALPDLAYAGLLMTEVAYYPLLALAAWASASALARPTGRNQALAAAAVVLCLATRLQAVVLLAALPSAAGLLALFERRLEPLRRLLPALGALAALAAAWAGWRLASGRPLLGAYEAAASSYGAAGAARWVVYHAGDLVLLTAAFPVLAVALLALDALAGRERSPEVRAYLAVAVSLSAWVVLQVGVFASRYVGHLAERNLFSLAPVLLPGFAVWLARGGPRPWLATSAVSLLALAAVVALPLGNVLSLDSLPFSLSAIPLWHLLGGASRGTQQAVVFGGAGLAVALFALVPRRALWVLPAVALALLSAASVDASRYVADAASLQQVRFVGPAKRWVDRAAGGPVGYLYDGDRDWDAVWENLFWNERIDAVYDIQGIRIAGALPQTDVYLRDDGRILRYDQGTIRQRYLVASTNLTLFGTPVASAPQQLPGQAGLRLWRLDGPPRVSTQTTGVQPNGDVWGGTTGTLTAYGCARGVFRLTLLVKQPGSLTIARNGTPWRRLRFAATGVWHGQVPAAPTKPDGRGTCSLSLSPTGLLGTTVLELDRS